MLEEGLGLGLLELLLPLSLRLMHKWVVVMPVVGVDRGNTGQATDSAVAFVQSFFESLKTYLSA